MKIKEIHIENYRSLKNITFSPGDLTVVIGPNGSGKTNLASAFDFLAEIYSNGLNHAVRTKGGFENIAFRGKRRTKSAIRFCVDFVVEDSNLPFLFFDMEKKKHSVRVVNSFSFQAARQSIRAEYRVMEEVIKFYVDKDNIGNELYKEWPLAASIEKEGSEFNVEYAEHQNKKTEKENYLAMYLNVMKKRGKYDELSTDLVTPQLLRSGEGMPDEMSVHQFSPQRLREPSAPSPSPKLTNYGENLAVLVDWLSTHHAKKWAEVENSMREIITGLESISVGYSSNKLLTLSFKDMASNNPWNPEDVSDGTIQTLGILCCLADPRTSLLFLEEPENSVHPWIVRQLTKEFKKYSTKTQIILTTHSPVVLNLVTPNDVWVCYKLNGETRVAQLPTLHPDLVTDWEAGDQRLYELLDMGLVSEAVPQGQLS